MDVTKGELIYLGESSSCDIGYIGYDPESFTMWCMKIPSLDVIKFAHFDIHLKKKILIVFDDSNAKYHSDTVRNCSLRCL